MTSSSILLLEMIDFEVACGPREGRRRPLSPLWRVSHLRETSFLLVWLLFLSESCHGAAQMSVRVHDRNENPSKIHVDDNGHNRIQAEPSETRRNLRRLNNHDPTLPAPAKRVLTEPHPTFISSTSDNISLENTAYDISERNDEQLRFWVELSFAVVVNTALNASNATHEDALLAIVGALDIIIANDTEFALYSAYNETDTVNNDTESGVASSWVYTLKQNNSTAKERVNSTECQVVDSNETVTVTWVKAVVEYVILPELSKVNDSGDDGHEFELVQDYGVEEEESTDDVFEQLDPSLSHSETHRSSEHQWDWHTVGSTVVNATRARIDDGSILEWIQHQDLSVVGVSQVGTENITQCIVVDMNPTLPIPFVDPLDLQSWDALQMLGSIIFGLTLLGTSLLCLIGRNRSKAVRIEEWSARIGDESAVNDFLTLSSQFLPPECVNQRDEKAAKIVTIPVPPCYPMSRADSTACRDANHQ